MKYYQPLGEQADAPYIDANSAGGIEGSAVPAGAIEHPQREIINAIKAAGLEPDAEDVTQLSQAIEIMLSKVVSLPPQAGNSGKILTTDGTNASWDEASEFITGLNVKLNKDGSNIEFNPVAKSTVVGWSMPDYGRAYNISAASMPYILPQDSQVCIVKPTTVGTYLQIYANGKLVFSDSSGSTNTSDQGSTFLASKGVVLTSTGNTTIGPSSNIVPLKGV